jgi:multidrug resistance efflux pump
VTPGQEVKKGDLLMEVTQDEIDYKLGQVKNKYNDIAFDVKKQKKDILDEISQLDSKKQAKILSYKVQISGEQTLLDQQKKLIENLSTIDANKFEETSSAHYNNIESLKQLMNIEIKPYEVEIDQLQQKLKIINTPLVNAQSQFQKEEKFLKDEQEKLKIIAPSDGLIGNISCKEGENISAFTSLLNFYEPRPTIVKGFVHESLILSVQRMDSLQITSILHPDLKVYGTVIGLGNRIVEIPERMRKMPDIKTYGREVLIRISPNNPFLQKEKVFLNAITENGISDQYFNDTTASRLSQTNGDKENPFAENSK